MELKDLIGPCMSNPGTLPSHLGINFPLTIDPPYDLTTLFGSTWLTSEYTQKEEIGGNLLWIVRNYNEPVVAANSERRRRDRSLSVGARPRPAPNGSHVSWARTAAPWEAPSSVKTGWTVLRPDGFSIGTGNSVSIPANADRGNVADFHTHPSTPGGTNLERCGYQPPSLEDLLAMQRARTFGKDIFISFVAAHTNHLYAMVYIRGLSHIDVQTIFEVIQTSLKKQGDLIKFPNKSAAEKFGAKQINFFNDYSTGKISEKMYNDQVRKLDDEQNLATGFGEKYAQLNLVHLKWACAVCCVGLYHGPIGKPLVSLA
ncbi:hypothetical protein [Acidisphaera sp. S103]|uniref:hypothetical protein n=1 Tax=Acidisphaera sp. S103 TaxID=1747223 RepID=UPI00131B25BF|nr:hypothetical protein [Acidisphaera sp. S103]